MNPEQETTLVAALLEGLEGMLAGIPPLGAGATETGGMEESEFTRIYIESERQILTAAVQKARILLSAARCPPLE